MTGIGIRGLGKIPETYVHRGVRSQALRPLETAVTHAPHSCLGRKAGQKAVQAN